MAEICQVCEEKPGQGEHWEQVLGGVDGEVGGPEVGDAPEDAGEGRDDGPEGEHGQGWRGVGGLVAGGGSGDEEDGQEHCDGDGVAGDGGEGFGCSVEGLEVRWGLRVWRAGIWRTRTGWRCDFLVGTLL